MKLFISLEHSSSPINLSNRIKIPYPLQWGAPTFDAGHSFGMISAVLVSLIEVNLYSSNIYNSIRVIAAIDKVSFLCSQLELTRQQLVWQVQHRLRLMFLVVELVGRFVEKCSVYLCLLFGATIMKFIEANISRNKLKTLNIQGIGILFDGLFGTGTGSTVSV